MKKILFTTAVVSLWLFIRVAINAPMALAEVSGEAIVIEPQIQNQVVVVSEPVKPKLIAPKELVGQVADGSYRDQLVRCVNDAAVEYRVDPWLVWVVVKYESTYQHYKGNEVKRGNAKEIGVSQIQPYWGRKFGHNLFDLRDNIRCCAEILAFAKYERGYDSLVTLGWYNTGKAIVNDYARRGHKQYHVWLATEA